ncbi:peptidase inhibitor family I36 protein [Streptomyces sp. NPDC057137]|uniref:peptidase inhibitor family I36 protein n=1 Tax=Streptomyces sp. NPDC057137 TaxID=3346030 RepID=UPI003639663F
MKRRLTVLFAAMAAGIAMLVTPGAASASPAPYPAVQSQIDEVLAETPGGVQTGPRTVEWNDGAVGMKFGIESWEDCRAEQVCFWEHDWFQGRFVYINSSECTNRTFDFKAWGFNDMTSSWRNNTSRNVYVFQHDALGGNRLWVEAPQQNAGALDPSIRDDASSFYCV